MLKLKIKKLRKGFSIRLYNLDKEYYLNVFSINKIRLIISYNTDELILKHGYNQKHIGF